LPPPRATPGTLSEGVVRAGVRVVFFGTPTWAVPSLEALIEAGTEVAAVVTNPDRPAGRGLAPRPPPVKEAARAAGLEVLQPPSARDPRLRGRLAELAPDAGIVVAYGRILPPALLRVPRLGFVNLHFSLLPAYRGAAPVQRALMDGATATGVSVIVLTEGMDEGPLLARRAVPVGPDESAGELGDRLARIGAPVLAAALQGYASGAISPRPQDHAAATYAPKVSDDEARVEWRLSARALADLVRALDPAPGAWTTLRGRRLKLFRARARPAATLAPGALSGGAELVAGTGSGDLVLDEVQLAGKRRMAGADLARGLRLRPGERLE
jgi:methionyl-tRNA formyltransferase